MEAYVGIDVGSVAVKAALCYDGAPRHLLKEATSPDVASQCSRLIERLCRKARVAARALSGVWAAGYGRAMVREAEGNPVSEIVANAAGSGWFWRNWENLRTSFGKSPHPPSRPEKFRTIIDVGGQDSKVITLSEEGFVDRFAMNDRCAAGTGRFLEVMADLLETDLPGLDAGARRADSAAPISSSCTVFAESEVVSLLAQGTPKEAVAAGLYASIADQVGSLALQTGCKGPIMFDGGPSHSLALRKALEYKLGSRLAVPPQGEFVTAVGAVMLNVAGA